jgi:formylglycine-generating enzyme required for sulfatase activity
LNVEALEIEGNHGSHVKWSVMHSIVFFEKVTSQVSVPRKGETIPLPKTLVLDLGDGVKMKLVRIEPGKFRMGSPPGEVGRGDDEAQHEVEIAKPYCLGVFDVTQSQYRQVMGMKPSYYSVKGDGWERVFGLNTDDFPVENVTWEDAMDFCRILSMLPTVRDKGWEVDLPTEAEWEYACRAGTETAFHYGNTLSSQQANFNGNRPYGGATQGPFLGRPTKVGSYAPNAWGLHDMHGNVLQWCKDPYDKGYQDGRKKASSQRVMRGGFWNFGATDCRAARRLPVGLTARGPGQLGFRVVVRNLERRRQTTH